MHIVFLTTEYPEITQQSGGIAEYTQKMANKLRNLGYDVSIILAGSCNFSEEVDGIEIISFQSKDYWNGIDGGFCGQISRIFRILINAYRFRREVNRLNQRKKISILQSSNYLSPLLFLDNHRFPVICRISSYAPLLRKAYGKNDNTINRIEDFFELLSVRKSFALIVPSEFMRGIYSRYVDKQITVMKTPVGNQSFSMVGSPEHENLKDFRVLTYFGSMSMVKGVDLIADIIKNILCKYHDVKFLFIGKDYGMPGFVSISDYIRKKQGNCTKRVIIKNQLDKTQLYSFVQDSYCCLFPSRIDNYPNAAIEAIGLGIPIVGSNNSSLEEMIVDGKTGYIFNNSDSKDFQSKLEIMLNLSEAKYAKMCRNVKVLYKQIQKEKRVEQLLNFYKDIIDEFKSQG